MSEDLNKLSIEELGRLFPIIITEYNPDWRGIYLNEKKMILKAIGSNNVKRIDHIGSTAVPGLCAKPTIDILIQVSKDTDCD
ncbi:MAG: GrpB family protein, partial [Bacteroidales bacterium]